MSSTLFIDYEDKRKLEFDTKLDETQTLKIHITKQPVMLLLKQYLISDLANIIIEYYNTDLPLVLEYSKHSYPVNISFKATGDKFNFDINIMFDFESFVNISFTSNLVLYDAETYIKHHVLNNVIFTDHFMSNGKYEEIYKEWRKNTIITKSFINFYMKQYHNSYEFSSGVHKAHTNVDITKFIKSEYDDEIEYEMYNNDIKITNRMNGNVIIRKIVDYRYLNTLFCIIKLLINCISDGR